MMKTRHRLIELGVALALGVARVAAADPSPASDDHTNYVYFHDEDHTSMSGSTKDIDHARRYQHGKEPVLWFRDGGQEYVVRDPDTLRQLDAIWKPIRDLGDAQGKLGTQQGGLGTQQGQLGAHQGLIASRQAALAVRESALDMRESNDALSPADRAALRDQRRALRDQQRALGKEMRELDRPMRELGQQMEVLGRQMEVLGKKMEIASHKADADMHALLRRTVATGLAKPAQP